MRSRSVACRCSQASRSLSRKVPTSARRARRSSRRRRATYRRTMSRRRCHRCSSQPRQCSGSSTFRPKSDRHANRGAEGVSRAGNRPGTPGLRSRLGLRSRRTPTLRSSAPLNRTSLLTPALLTPALLTPALLTPASQSNPAPPLRKRSLISLPTSVQRRRRRRSGRSCQSDGAPRRWRSRRMV